MTRFPHLILAGAVLGLSLPAAAQNNAAPANVVTPAPAPREGTVGPEQLRDFALPGTRQAPAPSTNDSPRTAPAPTERAVPAPATANRPAPDTARTTEPARAAPVATEPDAEAPRPQGTAPEPAPTSLPSALPPITPAPPVAAAPLPPITVSQPGTATSAPSQPLWWPWLLAAALGGIALALVLRQRRRPVLAGPAGRAFERASPEPDFTPPPRAPTPPAAPPPAPEAPPQAPRPAGLVTTRLRAPIGAPPPAVPPSPPVPAAKSGGIVSTRLRGWIELDLVVREILFTPGEARLRIDILVGNGGTGHARAIALETVTINGGEDQEAALAGFFARPAASTIAIPELGPLGETVLSHELVVPRGAIRAYEAGGKALFVPVIALNAAYRTASGEGRTGAAFLVGRDVPGSEKLAPVLLPDGDGRSLGLGVRRLEEAVRR
ncbi:hypothetical protein V6R86_01665 [Sphingomonas kaistensis]|uniref:Uncharacterized protein n=1 Tax=Sphingomonas kaistensis TaxID=298708 RepID=A0ABZ2G0Z9_9SPHN